ncbi:MULTISPECIES: SHOCT domain-containing protein [unclassified Blastococcus]
MRRLGTGLLVLVSALTLVLAGVSLWTRQTVIDTDRFVSTVDTMIDLPEVEARVNERVTETVMTQQQVQDVVDEALTALPPRLQQYRGTVENGIRSLVSAGVQRLLTSDPFRPLTNAALTSVHDQLVAGEPIEFTLGQAKERVPASLQDGVAGQVLDLLPDDAGVTLLSPADEPQLYDAIDLLEDVWWWLGLVALATLAGALGVSAHRRRTLRAWTVTTTVLLLLLLAALRLGRGALVSQARPENRDAVGAMYDVLASSLRSRTLWVLVAVLLVLVGTLVWGRLGVVAGVRSGVASARVQLRARRAEAAAAAASAADGGTPQEAAREPWPRRVAAWSRAFADGLQLRQRSARLGAHVRAHHGPVRWTGIVVAAVVVLCWPEPTLSVLAWIGALVALYLGAVAWLEDQAPGPPEAPDRVPAPAAAAPAAVPSAVVASAVVASDVVPEPRPASPADTLVPAALTPEAMSTLNGRLDLIVRLGAARDAGVLTDEEFLREKERLLSV